MVVMLRAVSCRFAIWLHAVALRAVRYVVLGCGAIGGTVAARLARDGHDVLVSDPDPEPDEPPHPARAASAPIAMTDIAVVVRCFTVTPCNVRAA